MKQNRRKSPLCTDKDQFQCVRMRQLGLNPISLFFLFYTKIESLYYFYDHIWRLDYIWLILRRLVLYTKQKIRNQSNDYGGHLHVTIKDNI